MLFGFVKGRHLVATNIMDRYVHTLSIVNDNELERENSDYHPLGHLSA
jgi:hypothetical protein